MILYKCFILDINIMLKKVLLTYFVEGMLVRMFIEFVNVSFK